jgi:hypothetical protein
MTIASKDVIAGQSVYSKRTLAFYDWAVLGISNRWIWRCPTSRLLEHFESNVTDNHLDVGVGTGYFLDRCRFASPSPRVGLMDLNADALEYAAFRISRYRPECYQQNVLEPVDVKIQPFDSVSMNYLLHCLPGSMEEKSVVFDRVKKCMNPQGLIFGSTLLASGVRVSRSARNLMRFYNRKKIFSNQGDSLDALESMLRMRFEQVRVEAIGSAALFSARLTRTDEPFSPAGNSS